jgi:hypothetical protein
MMRPRLLENQTELDSGGGKRSNHQSRLGAAVCRTSKSHKVEVASASHAVYVSHPKEVAALIEEAATHAQ